MRKLSIFLRTFGKSTFSLTYYHEIVKAPFLFSLKYFIVFSITLGLGLTFLLSWAILPYLTTFTSRVNNRISNLYPNDLIIELKDGQLTTNQAEPIRFPLPYELFMATPPAISDQNQLYLITIDTRKKPRDIADSKSIFFITRETISVKDSTDDASYRAYPLKEFGDAHIDKDTVTKSLLSLKPLWDFLPYLAVLVILGGCVLLLPVTKLIFLLFMTVLVWPLTHLFKLNLSYQKLVQIGLHALTLPTLIQLGLLLLGLNPPIPFFGTILYFLYLMVIMAELKHPAST